MSSAAPKVLHVIGRLNTGGVEMLLMNLARSSNRAEFPMEICVTNPSLEPGSLEREFQHLGGVIHRCPWENNLLTFSRRFRELLRRGNYDVLHSHIHLFSGYLLRLAALEGIPGRIAHSHTVEPAQTFKRKIYTALMRKWISDYATLGVACSDPAGQDLFGDEWSHDPRWRILWGGIDLSPFLTRDRDGVRRELGLSDQQLAVAHVGRIAPVKNHHFLIEIASVLRRLRPDFRMFLIGDGPLRNEIETQIDQLGLAGHVTMLGMRSDIARLLPAFDLFVMPSLFEGFGISFIEAQAAGLPSLLSTAITAEAGVFEGMSKHLELSAGPVAWAEACLAMAARRKPWTPATLARLSDRGYSVDACRNALVRTYRAAMGEAFIPDHFSTSAVAYPGSDQQ